MSYSSLYIHFPFCETKCHYCDFYSLAHHRTKESDRTRFSKALRKECELLAPSLSEKIDTIFFGGGTPSMTPPEEMSWILEPLELKKRITHETEWTMEANPSSIFKNNFHEYRDLGVNRISMGVQSLSHETLKKLGRAHDESQARTALQTVFEAGFKRVSVDLLCGVPGQSLDQLSWEIEELTSYPIDHISIYLLTLSKHHFMAKELPKDEIQLEHYLHIDQTLSKKGFDHYEISNFSKPGAHSKHNMNYWKLGSYLSLGPSAHSYDSASKKRWKNLSSLQKYFEKLEKNELPIEWEEALTEKEQEMEKWMLALRLSEGFPKTWVQSEKQSSKLRQLLNEKLIEPHPDLHTNYRLTTKGLALSDSIAPALFP